MILALGLAALIIILTFGAGGCGPHPLAGKPAPPFALMGLDDKAHDLGESIGKDVVLLDFWASWCPPCREGLPAIAELDREFAGRGLKTYAVNIMESKGAAAGFMAHSKLSLPVLLDETGHVAELYGVSGIPQTVIIGRDGVAHAVHVGFSSGTAASLRREIESLL